MAANPKPTDVARWANNGGAITVPSSGKQDVGWLTGERPPAQYKNWLANQAWRWHKFVDALFTDGGNSDGIAAGNADQQNTAEANVVPLFKWRDYLGKIRSLVDHNGYRMGQVSEIDETWDLPVQTAQLPMSAFVPTGGTWGFGDFWTCTVSGSLQCSLNQILPKGAVVTGILWSFSRTTASDVTTFDWHSSINGTATSRVAKTITTGTGNTTTDQMASPTTGQGPQQVGFGGNPAAAVDETVLQVSATVTTSLKVYGCTITYVVPPPRWTYTQSTLGASAAGDSIIMNAPISGLNQRNVQLTAAAISSQAGSSKLTGLHEVQLDSDAAYAVEFMIKTGTITDGSNKRLFSAMLLRPGGDGVGLYNDNSQANWQYQRIVGGTPTNVDTGVAIAASTVYRVRLEVYGTAVNSSGATRVRLYLNGALVADSTAVTLTADGYQLVFRAATNGTTGGPYDWRIGRVRRAWNHLLTADNL